MIIDLFTSLDAGLNSGIWWAALAAGGWGILSVLLSPCHLSSIPLLVAFIGSQGSVTVGRSFRLALIFAVGVLFSIVLIGGITFGLGRMLGDVGPFGNWLVAGIFLLVGLYLLDLLPLPNTGINLQRLGFTGRLGALLLGLIFGIALGPCTFAFMAPVLGAVFKLAVDKPLQAGIVLAGFGIGQSLVIVLAGSLVGLVQKYLKWTERSKGMMVMRRSCGLLIIAGGIYFLVTA